MSTRLAGRFHVYRISSCDTIGVRDTLQQAHKLAMDAMNSGEQDVEVMDTRARYRGPHVWKLTPEGELKVFQYRMSGK